MSKVHFGVTLPQIKRPWTAAAEAAKTFESLGFHSLWVCDHFYGPQSPQLPILEAWSMVSAVAAITDRAEIGTLVTPAGMRNPAHLGKTIASIDNIAGGRIIAGLGAGWMPREFSDFNVPFLSTSDRLKQLGETVDLLQRMWGQEEEVSYEGEFVKADRVVCQPKPVRKVPILIGGAGEKVTLNLTAKKADIWNNLAAFQSQLEHKVGVLKKHCASVGRDFSEIRVSQQCLVTIAASIKEADEMSKRAEKVYGGHMGDPQGSLAIAGNGEQCCEKVQRHIDLGCDMFVVEFFGKDTIEPATLFAEEVIPEFT